MSLPTYGHFDGKGAATMSWFIHRFKPFIDRNFRTLPDREHTFIGGSSMGGLMSLYALLNHNDVFGRAAALSPSIWVSPEKLSGLLGRAKLEPGTVLYMDYGSREMGNHEGMRKGFADMCSKVMIRGIHLTARLVPGGTHSEASWEKQLPFMIADARKEAHDEEQLRCIHALRCLGLGHVIRQRIESFLEKLIHVPIHIAHRISHLDIGLTVSLHGLGHHLQCPIRELLYLEQALRIEWHLDLVHRARDVVGMVADALQ